MNSRVTILLKKRVGEKIDLGDGYTLIIKQIDSKRKRVILELQLDELKIDETRKIEHETVDLYNYSVIESDISGPSMTLENISQDEGGNYSPFIPHFHNMLFDWTNQYTYFSN